VMRARTTGSDHSASASGSSRSEKTLRSKGLGPTLRIQT
jgi:hypothetical protein